MRLLKVNINIKSIGLFSNDYNLKHSRRCTNTLYCPTKAKDLNSLECETEKITLKFFTCPAKLIIGRTLEIWQLDVLVMKIIYISSNLIFTPSLKLMYSAFAFSAKSEKSHQG